MSIIIEIAERFAKRRLSFPTKHKEIIADVRYELSEIDNDFDKIQFLTILLETNNKERHLHSLSCTDKDICDEEFGYKNIEYYLSQELNRLGVNINQNNFTVEEKRHVEDKIDNILQEINLLKAKHKSQHEDIMLSQQVIYEDLLAELNNLKELFFLGKKTWYQLLIGKGADMVAGGVVSEVVSKQIVEEIHKAIPNLIG